LGFLKKNSIDFNSYLQNISDHLEIDLPLFTYDTANYRNSELKSQLLAYAFSCSISDVFKQKGISIDYVAGYSMGIYASLYATRSISLEEGAKFIFMAYKTISELAESRIYGMGAIIGLPIKDIEYLINENNLDTEIINVNNEHSLVIAGEKEGVELVLNKAKEEGAMSAVELIVNTPYHSKYMLKFSDLIKEHIDNIPIKEAEIPIISTYNQREFKTISEIKSELLINLTAKINWYKTMQRLINNDVSEFYECGAGKDLKKISRFISGNYRINSIYKL
jgi:[acyl-carrier-protein] S-malonyltransferase